MVIGVALAQALLYQRDDPGYAAQRFFQIVRGDMCEGPQAFIGLLQLEVRCSTSSLRLRFCCCTLEYIEPVLGQQLFMEL
jgi:hypothetical protein